MNSSRPVVKGPQQMRLGAIENKTRNRPTTQGHHVVTKVRAAKGNRENYP